MVTYLQYVAGISGILILGASIYYLVVSWGNYLFILGLIGFFVGLFLLITAVYSILKYPSGEKKKA